KITIETTQNVDIEYDIASVGDRIVANIIDTLIIVGYVIILMIIFFSIFRPNMFTPAMGVVLFILALPVFLYYLLCETFMNGQSFGKRAMKIKVIRMDGRQPTFGNYLVRWILRIVDNGIVALIAVIASGKGQRLGDMAAGTCVIKIRTKEVIKNTAFEKVEEAYVPIFPEAMHLTDKDASTIKQVLNLSVTETEDVAAIETKLAAKLKQHLNIHTSLGDADFLRTLLKDYNMISGKL
ncbi:MAG TPA: RDD family protein, partial [Bacteroidia bacterium]|nr:RDD family protein [Bacteroidia bacterium]